jgi:multiple sugar transport system substrate-binding protein
MRIPSRLRPLASGLSSVGLCLLLAACGGGSSTISPADRAGGGAAGGASQAQAPNTGQAAQPTSAGNQAAAGGQIKLTYFNARGAEAVERALVSRYMQEHPNIEIDYLASTAMPGPSDTDAIANLVFNIQSGNVVDVAKVETTRTPMDLMAAKAVQDLSKINNDAVQARLQDLLNTEYVQIKGGVYALVYEYDPFAYIYNGTMWKEAGLNPDQPPKTWDELRAAATTLKSKFQNTWPVCHPLKNLAKIQPYVWSAGGTFWDRDVLPTKSDLLNPGTLAAYNFLREWSQKSWLNTDEITTTTQVQFMISRQCAGMNLSSDLALQLRANDPNTDWRVTPIPPMDASHQSINYAGGSSLVVPSTSAHPKEALDFILWLTDQQAQRLKWGLDQGLQVSAEDLAAEATPANKKVAGDSALVNDPKWSGVLVNVPTRASGVSPIYSQAYQILADAQERIARTQSDPQTELRAAQDQIQKLIDDNKAKMPDLYT